MFLPSTETIKINVAIVRWSRAEECGLEFSGSIRRCYLTCERTFAVSGIEASGALLLAELSPLCEHCDPVVFLSLSLLRRNV